MFIAMFAPGPMEMAVVGLIALLLFGSRLPKVMRGLGSSITEFRKGVNGVEDVKDSIADAGNEVVDEVKKAANNAKKTKG